jgi:hypothetical protein
MKTVAKHCGCVHGPIVPVCKIANNIAMLFELNIARVNCHRIMTVNAIL